MAYDIIGDIHGQADKYRSRIDYVLASPVLDVVSATYLTEVEGTIIAAPGDRNPISDHAILYCEVLA